MGIVLTTDNNQFLADGITPNPNYGKVTQTTAPDAALSYQSLSQIGFITLCQEAGGMTDAQLVACEADANFKALWIKFQAAQTIDQIDPRVQAGLAGLATAGYLPNGAAAVNAAWPKS